ncbi:MAG: hydroxyacid dehydrogenase, partial [Variovorax sp.]
NVDRLLEFNDRPVLQNSGRIGAEQMKAIVQGRYDDFDARRRSSEALAADVDELNALEAVEKETRRKKDGQ